MSYTCNSCNLAFTDPGEQRAHMKSDWHRYNLKRRVAQLPPIDEDLFQSKVASLNITDDKSDTRSKSKQTTKKEIRKREREAIQEKKRQILETAKQAMLANDPKSVTNTPPSLDHKKVNENTDRESDDESKDIEEVNVISEGDLQEKLMAEKLQNRIDIPITTCLFCHCKKNAEFETLEKNLDHMFLKHGLYIPEQAYLVDKEGLIKYLGEKIGLGNVCLCCNYQGKNIEAVREHMLYKRHMRIPYESEDEKLEISEFYDFSSTYDSQVNAGDQENDEEWEDVSEEDSDGDSPEPESIYQNGHELILPSGAVIGHRSLARYYKQNLPPDRILLEGQGTVVAAETRRMARRADRQEVATQSRVWKQEKKREQLNDKRAKKFINNQPHYRDQLLQ
ncbi:uncharacterized protein PRCAT00003440001 [Priceomyces carsonii]|uniref:uncharacterized protein n=1 Tax=Priceomyces carsonii TaxID=28549 RepID=UPI002ED8C89C|nr:unnamed protein product [Priceomyces carsonii]